METEISMESNSVAVPMNTIKSESDQTAQSIDEIVAGSSSSSGQTNGQPQRTSGRIRKPLVYSTGDSDSEASSGSDYTRPSSSSTRNGHTNSKNTRRSSRGRAGKGRKSVSSRHVTSSLTDNLPSLPETVSSNWTPAPVRPATGCVIDSNEIAPFVLKLKALLDDSNTDHVIRWTEDGHGFEMLRPKELAEKILPRLFKASNPIESFTRQLNGYGFRFVHSDAGNRKFAWSREQCLVRYQHDVLYRNMPQETLHLVRPKIPVSRLRQRSLDSQVRYVRAKQKLMELSRKASTETRSGQSVTSPIMVETTTKSNVTTHTASLKSDQSSHVISSPPSSSSSTNLYNNQRVSSVRANTMSTTVSSTQMHSSSSGAILTTNYDRTVEPDHTFVPNHTGHTDHTYTTDHIYETASDTIQPNTIAPLSTNFGVSRRTGGTSLSTQYEPQHYSSQSVQSSTRKRPNYASVAASHGAVPDISTGPCPVGREMTPAEAMHVSRYNKRTRVQRSEYTKPLPEEKLMVKPIEPLDENDAFDDEKIEELYFDDVETSKKGVRLYLEGCLVRSDPSDSFGLQLAQVSKDSSVNQLHGPLDSLSEDEKPMHRSTLSSNAHDLVVTHVAENSYASACRLQPLALSSTSPLSSLNSQRIETPVRQFELSGATVLQSPDGSERAVDIEENSLRIQPGDRLCSVAGWHLGDPSNIDSNDYWEQQIDGVDLLRAPHRLPVRMVVERYLENEGRDSLYGSPPDIYDD